MLAYSKKLKEYEQQDQKYKEDIQRLKSTEYIVQFRLSELVKYFSSLPKPTNNKLSKFYQYHKIFSDLLINVFNNDVFFSENSATIIDQDTQIAIVIKIDIPYDIDSGTDYITDTTFSKCINVFLQNRKQFHNPTNV